MKVILAKHSGFCFGVEKAINTTYNRVEMNTSNNPIYTLGPLIHNNHVVNELELKGVKVVEDINNISEGIVIIRSHGVPENIYDIARDEGLEIIDATCPYVKRIQNIVKDHHQKGYTIIIVGNPDHPEVVGINGWCDNSAIIINSISDAQNVSYIDNLCLVSQTTMTAELYEAISSILKDKAGNFKNHETICAATKQRQDSARSLVQEVDFMIIIGDKHSSNTNKLLQICESVKPGSSLLIQSKDELPLEQLKKYAVVGVTAGASAPDVLIKDIVEILKNL